MSALNLSTVLILLSLNSAPAIGAESKIAQCNQLVDVTNQASSEVTAIGKTPSTTVEQSATMMGTMAQRLDYYSQKMKTLPLRDGRLKRFQTRFAALYKVTANNSRSMVSALRQRDRDRAEQAMQSLTMRAKEEQNLISEINRYCSDR